jgi:magnesium-transporting ATPase (P-type)
MDAAIHVLALRCGLQTPAPHAVTRRHPFDPRRRRSSAVARGALHVLGASDSVLPRCVGDVGPVPAAVVADMTASGLRVVAVARRPTPEEHPGLAADEIEKDLRLLGIVGLEDPPREGVEHAVAACRRAGIRLAMVTGDHPGTARAIATEAGLLGPDAIVISGSELPGDDAMLGELLERDGVVVARVTPEDNCGSPAFCSTAGMWWP